MSDDDELDRLAAELALLELEVEVARLSSQSGPWRRGLFDHERLAGTDFAGIDSATSAARERLGLLLVRARRTVLDALAQDLLGRADLHSPADVAQALLDPALSTADPVARGFRGLFEMVRAQLLSTARAEMDRAVQEMRRQGGTVGRVDESTLVAVADAQARRLTTLLLGEVVRAVQEEVGLRAGRGFADSGDGAALLHEVLADALGRSERSLLDLAGQAVNTAGGSGRLAGLYAVGPGDEVRWYASELLDERTCDPCSQVDGTQYASLAAAQADYPAGVYDGCLGGDRCRGTIVAVLANEEPAVVQ